ncbi:MAG: hypothetical protein ACYTFG_16625 [Planctomycetota bacterium]
MNLSPNTRNNVQGCLELILQALPDGWELLDAFMRSDDDYDFDTEPGTNYNQGYIQGVADALNISVSTLISTVGVSPSAKNPQWEE